MRRKREIGFVVEGPTDEVVVDALAKRLGAQDFAIVPLMGSARIMSAEASVLTLLEKGYRHVLVVFDTDTTSAATNYLSAQVASRVFDRVAPAYGHMERQGGRGLLTIPVTFIGLEPDIERDWLRHERKIAKDPGAYARAAAQLDLDRLAKESPQFRLFRDEVFRVMKASPSPRGGATTKPANPKLRKTA